MAETNNVDIASIMNMVATLSPEGSGARKDVIIEPAAPAPAPVSEPAPSASPARAATVRTLGSAGLAHRRRCRGCPGDRPPRGDFVRGTGGPS